MRCRSTGLKPNARPQGVSSDVEMQIHPRVPRGRGMLALCGGATAQAADAPATPAADVGARPAPGAARPPTLYSGTHTIQSSGQNRSFILKVPANYDRNRPHKLIFGNHWWGGTANDVASGGSDGAVYAHYGLDALSGGSAIFVAPQGQNNAWANSNGRGRRLLRRHDQADRRRPLRRRDAAVLPGLQLRRGDELRAGVRPAGHLPRRHRRSPSRDRSADAPAALGTPRTWASRASPTACSRRGRCATGSSPTTAARRRARVSPLRAAAPTSPPRTRAAVPGSRSCGPRSTADTSRARSTAAPAVRAAPGAG